MLLITSTRCCVDGVHCKLHLHFVNPCGVSRILIVPGLMQVIGVFTLAEVLVPLREAALLNVFDRNLLPTFLVVSGTISSDVSDSGSMHISK